VRIHDSLLMALLSIHDASLRLLLIGEHVRPWLLRLLLQ
jgi:hypothetical protein